MIIASQRAKLVSFACMCMAFSFMTVEVVRAESLSNWCWFWHAQYDVDCSIDGPNMTTWGDYDFSGMDENDALSLANDLCASLWGAANDTCESEDYQEYLAGYHGNEYPAGCFITWAGGGSCQMGTTGSFSQGCGYFNWCAS